MNALAEAYPLTFDLDFPDRHGHHDRQQYARLLVRVSCSRRLDDGNQGRNDVRRHVSTAQRDSATTAVNLLAIGSSHKHAPIAFSHTYSAKQ